MPTTSPDREAADTDGPEPDVDDEPTDGEASSDAATDGALWRVEGARFLELVAMTGLAIAQPMLDLYGNNPTEFVQRNTSPISIVLFALAIALVPPLVLFALTLPLRLVGPRAEQVAQRVVLGILAGLFVVQVAIGLSAFRWVLGIAAAVGLFVLCSRTDAAQRTMRYISPATALFVALFLFTSQVTPLITSRNREVDVTAAAGNPAPVVFLLLDELPLSSLLDGNGQIDATLFPNFAEMAASSTWYQDMSTVSNATTAAVPGLTTGLYPHSDTPTIDQHPDNIFTMLGGAGYEMNVQETVTNMCPPSLCTRIQPGALPGITDLATHAAGAWADRITGDAPTEENRIQLSEFESESSDGISWHDPTRVDRWLSGLTDPDVPGLNFLHLVFPHFPWEISPIGTVYDDHEILAQEFFGYSWNSERGAQSAQMRHLLQTQYTDLLLGRVIDDLKRTGLWDTAVIVVTADHGMSFRVGDPIRGITNENAWEMMWVPFFLRAPGIAAGAVDTREATTLDIMPTLTELLQLEAPYPFDGVSLLSAEQFPQPTRYVYKNLLNRVEPDPETGYAAIPAAPNRAKVMATERHGQGDDDLRLWRTGPYGSMVGTDVLTYPDGGLVGTFTPTNDTASVLNYDPEERPAELLAIADVDTDAEWVAIALNNTIVAVVPARGGYTNRSAYTVLPESLMTPGRNEVTYWAVTGDGTELSWLDEAQ